MSNYYKLSVSSTADLWSTSVKAAWDMRSLQCPRHISTHAIVSTTYLSALQVKKLREASLQPSGARIWCGWTIPWSLWYIVICSADNYKREKNGKTCDARTGCEGLLWSEQHDAGSMSRGLHLVWVHHERQHSWAPFPSCTRGKLVCTSEMVQRWPLFKSQLTNIRMRAGILHGPHKVICLQNAEATKRKNCQKVGTNAIARLWYFHLRPHAFSRPHKAFRRWVPCRPTRRHIMLSWIVPLDLLPAGLVTRGVDACVPQKKTTLLWLWNRSVYQVSSRLESQWR